MAFAAGVAQLFSFAATQTPPSVVLRTHGMAAEKVRRPPNRGKIPASYRDVQGSRTRFAHIMTRTRTAGTVTGSVDPGQNWARTAQCCANQVGDPTAGDFTRCGGCA